jgi:hypothetical protein
VPSAIAGLALTQEYRHPHLELFGKRDDALAVLLDGFAMRVARPRRAPISEAPATRRTSAKRSVSLALRATAVVALFCCSAPLRPRAEQRPEDVDDVGDPLHGVEAGRGVALQAHRSCA